MYLGMPKWKNMGQSATIGKYTIRALPLLDGYVMNTQQEVMYRDI